MLFLPAKFITKYFKILIKITITNISKVGQCFWRKNNRLIYLYPGKYEWSGDPRSGDCSLRIKVNDLFLCTCL